MKLRRSREKRESWRPEASAVQGSGFGIEGLGLGQYATYVLSHTGTQYKTKWNSTGGLQQDRGEYWHRKLVGNDVITVALSFQCL